MRRTNRPAKDSESEFLGNSIHNLCALFHRNDTVGVKIFSKNIRIYSKIKNPRKTSFTIHYDSDVFSVRETRRRLSVVQYHQKSQTHSANKDERLIFFRTK